MCKLLSYPGVKTPTNNFGVDSPKKKIGMVTARRVSKRIMVMGF